MNIKKGDTVLIISGDDKGRKGKVVKTLPLQERILVQGVNIQKRHQKPKKEGEKGQIVEKPGSIHVSNIKLICPKCGKPTRMGGEVKLKVPFGPKASGRGQSPPHQSKLNAGQAKARKTKVRICKKCGKIM